MRIKRLEVKNFKSFKELKIDLGKFNVVIGANASGKSNFAAFFEFLRDIEISGLENAISMQGGVEYLRNMNIGSSEPMSVKVIFDRGKDKLILPTKLGLIGLEIYEEIYEFVLKFRKRGMGFKIEKDELIQKCKFLKLEKKNGKKAKIIGEGKIIISNSEGKLKIDISKLASNIPIGKEDIFFSPLLEREIKIPEQMLLLQTPFLFILPFPTTKANFREISIYDFDPKLPKKATPITGKSELEMNGSNLSIILKNIIENEERRRMLFNLIKNLLPFVENLDVEKFADKSLLFKLKESYFKEQYLPASLISDGTINITALIIALYFEKKSFVILEEPERNIHPSLISKVVEMMKDASQRKQIIVTTHNPEFVKYTGLENIFLISRDEDGFSIVSRPANKESVKTFLKNDIGIEELYIQSLLEV